MPGTVVRDALEVDLLADATLDSATTSQGTALEVGWPQHVGFALEVNDTIGADHTLVATIEGCETSDFSTDPVVTLGTISVADGDEGGLLGFETYVDAKFVRANVTTDGTSPDFTGATLKVVQPHYLRVRGASWTAAAVS